MKLINENPWQYLSVKLPMLGAFFMLVLIPLLQWALDFQLIPKQHEAVVVGIIIPLLGLIGKKIYQPELHAPQLNGVNSLLATPQNSNDLAWMIEAKKHVGLREIVGKQHNKTILGWIKGLGGWFTDDETPWCGTFVAHCLKTAGVKYPKHWYRALDYVNYGSKLAKPAYGCVAIKTRKGGGHVCFVVGRDQETKKLVCLGGNQGNAVSYALYSDSDFQEFRWYGKTSRAAESRYNLAVLSGVSATKVNEA